MRKYPIHFCCNAFDGCWKNRFSTNTLFIHLACAVGSTDDSKEVFHFHFLCYAELLAWSATYYTLLLIKYIQLTSWGDAILILNQFIFSTIIFKLNFDENKRKVEWSFFLLILLLPCFWSLHSLGFYAKIYRKKEWII